MILYPDQRIEQPDNETVCFAAPIDYIDWEFFRARAHKARTGMKFLRLKDDTDIDAIPEGTDFCSVYFMRNEAEINDEIIIFFRDNEDDDTCLESAAWIRIEENFPGMIYFCRGSLHADKWQTHAASLGAPESSVCMVDIGVHTSGD